MKILMFFLCLFISLPLFSQEDWTLDFENPIKSTWKAVNYDSLLNTNWAYSPLKIVPAVEVEKDNQSKPNSLVCEETRTNNLGQIQKRSMIFTWKSITTNAFTFGKLVKLRTSNYE